MANGRFLTYVLAAAALVATGCSKENHTVGGTVTGLTGTGLVIELNGQEQITINADRSFTFSKQLQAFDKYRVKVKTTPFEEACTVANGEGRIGGNDITVVKIVCRRLFGVSGVVTGLNGPGLLLQLNGEHDITVDIDGAFDFGRVVPDGTDYVVTATDIPSGESCVVTDGVGTMDGGDVVGVAVICAPSQTGLLGMDATTPSIYTSIDETNGNATAVSTNIDFDALAGLAYDSASGVLFGVDAGTDTLVRIDPLFGSPTVIGVLNFDSIFGLAYDPLSDLLFGVHSPAGATAEVVTINPATAVATAVGAPFALTATCEGLTFDTRNDVLYGSTSDGDLLTLDPVTGQLLVTVPLEEASPVNGLAYDGNRDRLFGLQSQELLVEIDPTDGTTDELGPIEGHAAILGLTYSADLDDLFGTDTSPPGASTLLNIDEALAEAFTVGSSGFVIEGLANDPNNGSAFGMAPGANLVYVDRNTGQSRFFKALNIAGSQEVRSLAFDPTRNRLFGFSIDPVGGDRLVSIRPGNGKVEEFPPLGADGDFEALAIDTDGSRAWGVLDPGAGMDCRLYRVNLNDGSVSELVPLTGFDQVRALAFNQAELAADRALYAVDALSDQLIRVDLMTLAVTTVGPTADVRGMLFVVE